MFGETVWDAHWRMSPRQLANLYTTGGDQTRAMLDRYLQSQRDDEQRELQEWLWPRDPALPRYERPARWSGHPDHDPT